MKIRKQKRKVLWVNANIAKTLPDEVTTMQVSPLTMADVLKDVPHWRVSPDISQRFISVPELQYRARKGDPL